MGHRRRHLRGLAALSALFLGAWVAFALALDPPAQSVRTLIGALSLLVAGAAVAAWSCFRDRPLLLLAAGPPLLLAPVVLWPPATGAWILESFGLLVTLLLVGALASLCIVWHGAPSNDSDERDLRVHTSSAIAAPTARPQDRNSSFGSLVRILLVAHLLVGPAVALVRGDAAGGHPMLALLLPLLIAVVVVSPVAFTATPPAIDARLLLGRLRRQSPRWQRAKAAAALALAFSLVAGWASVAGVW
jgi:hypothetical protein